MDHTTGGPCLPQNTAKAAPIAHRTECHPILRDAPFDFARYTLVWDQGGSGSETQLRPRKLKLYFAAKRIKSEALLIDALTVPATPLPA